MKKFVITIWLLTFILLTACHYDFLDTTPYNAIGSSNMWDTEIKADQGVAGIYQALKNSTTGGENYKTFDGLGFVNTYYGTSDPFVLEYLRGTITPDNGIFATTWAQHFEGIGRANDAIGNLQHAGLSEEKYQRLISEARFLRAFFYYRLNALFKGVPIYNEPFSATEMTKGQASVEEVYAQCIEDLTFCIENPHLPNNTLASSGYGRVSKGAAYALRGMVYMWMHNYTAAIADLSEVENMGYGLWQGEWSNFFKTANERDKEMILPLQYDAAPGFSSSIQKFVGGRSHYDGWTEAQPSTDFVNSYLNADGSQFQWEDFLPGWNNMTIAEREVFFLRDGLSSSSTDARIRTVYQEAANRIGSAGMAKYLPQGNENRIKQAYSNRDPRLQKTVFTPYSTAIGFNANWNSGNEQESTLRWPLIANVEPFLDMWNDKRSTAFYMYKKYNETRKGVYLTRDHCDIDFPLIRFTDVQLLLAEAYNENNQTELAIAAFNRIRTRPGVEMPPLTNGGSGPNAVLNQTDMRERIQYERRVELCLEGINYFDELRWGTWKKVKFNDGPIGAGRKSWWGFVETDYSWRGEHMNTWPVPLREIMMNPNMVKTPGWIY